MYRGGEGEGASLCYPGEVARECPTSVTHPPLPISAALVSVPPGENPGVPPQQDDSVLAAGHVPAPASLGAAHRVHHPPWRGKARVPSSWCFEESPGYTAGGSPPRKQVQVGPLGTKTSGKPRAPLRTLTGQREQIGPSLGVEKLAETPLQFQHQPPEGGD